MWAVISIRWWQLIDHGVDEGFIRPHHRELFVVDDEPARLLDRLADSSSAAGGYVPTGWIEA